MPKVTYIEYNGKEHPVDLPVGKSVMRGAVDNNIPGIDADCGGECACATCHVYVDPDWLESFAATAEPNSRLSCQIKISEALDGLIVRMPEGQH